MGPYRPGPSIGGQEWETIDKDDDSPPLSSPLLSTATQLKTKETAGGRPPTKKTTPFLAADGGEKPQRLLPLPHPLHPGARGSIPFALAPEVRPHLFLPSTFPGRRRVWARVLAGLAVPAGLPDAQIRVRFTPAASALD